jgi:hypothetical protein
MTPEPLPVALNAWKSVPCLYCQTPIEATSDVHNAPYFLPRYRAWAHNACFFSVGEGAPKEAQAALFTSTIEEEEATA